MLEKVYLEAIKDNTHLRDDCESLNYQIQTLKGIIQKFEHPDEIKMIELDMKTIQDENH